MSSPDLQQGTSPHGRPPDPETLRFERDGLPQVRRQVEAAAARAGLPAVRMADLALAASELAANSVVHGGGGGTLRIWRESDRLVVEVEDSGLIEQPLAGLGQVRPPPTQLSGRGLWLAHQLCDRVQIRSGVHGTRVRLDSAVA